MSKHERSRFAVELNKILEESSRSAEDVVEELNRRGFPLPFRTFSYWLQGYFLPHSDGAFQLVSILENMCGVEENRLSDALLQDLSSGASFVPGEWLDSEVFGAQSLAAEQTRFATAVSRAIDWKANLIQKVVRDEVTVSADYKKTHHKATVLARVPAVPDPTFIFQLLYGPHERVDGEDYFQECSGITLDKQEIFEEEDGSRICVTKFSIPDSAVPGTLHKFSYSWNEESDTPLTQVNERLFPWSLDFYSCSITFEGN
ncbi:MAG: hypothetical protein IKZ87_09330, partial [Actinomycetaceae bacterium]|nr:hypothetical protein [Actinomycetaceae bacterium]